jgi:hypothetical protein
MAAKKPANTTFVGVNVPDRVVRQVDECARQNGLTRSEVIKQILEVGAPEYLGYTGVFRSEAANGLMRMFVPLVARAAGDDPKDALARLDEVLAIARQDRQRAREEEDAEGLRVVPEQ